MVVAGSYGVLQFGGTNLSPNFGEKEAGLSPAPVNFKHEGIIIAGTLHSLTKSLVSGSTTTRIIA